MKTGVEQIADERQEQIGKHGRTIESDVTINQYGQLAIAALKLCDPKPDVPNFIEPEGWNTDLWDKMISKTYKERLIIAGALIAAEIDRLQVLEARKEASNG